MVSVPAIPENRQAMGSEFSTLESYMMIADTVKEKVKAASPIGDCCLNP
jgi:hypothetical protein